MRIADIAIDLAIDIADIAVMRIADIADIQVRDSQISRLEQEYGWSTAMCLMQTTCRSISTA